MRSPLSLCVFHTSDALSQTLLQHLRNVPLGETEEERYSITLFSNRQDLLNFIELEAHRIDCLILQETPDLPWLLERLQQWEAIFPTVIVQSNQGASRFISDSSNNSSATNSAEANLPESDSLEAQWQSVFPHPAMLILAADHLSQIGDAIEQVISKFIQLSLSQKSPNSQSAGGSVEFFNPQRSQSLTAQQVRLAKKLKERLGYLGVYYKRNPQNFLRHMTASEREELLRQLRQEYREIILAYFSEEPGLNQKLDNFVNVAFFADVSVSQIVEIHMDLMDEFSKQLKLEGRSDEILQDYRLTLIDTIAHLCEMYRRSIPRES